VSALGEIKAPAPAGSGEPNLCAAPNGRIYLSWLAEEDNRTSLQFAVYENERWSSPQTIASGQNWFVNWADFPSLVASKERMAAHWLVKNGEGSYAYDVHLAFSADGGRTWSDPIVPHDDGTETEHGFVSLLPWSDNDLFAVWLDGRNFAEPADSQEGQATTHEMTLQFALIDKNGNVKQQHMLDSRTCDCCPTSAARIPGGAVVVYRDRSGTEVRDISILRFQNGTWSQPLSVFADGWQIEGCPVNGPAVAAHGEELAIAWFTMAGQTPQVKAIFSHDAGVTFGDLVAVDDGDPVGRVDAVLLDDGSALVSWLEHEADGTTDIRVRRVKPDGSRDSAFTATESSRQRASGMPRMVRNDEAVMVAWTEPGPPSRVRTAVLNVNQFQE